LGFGDYSVNMAVPGDALGPLRNYFPPPPSAGEEKADSGRNGE
jgi:hypothetical protein